MTRWMITICYRSRPGNSEWRYKTIVSSQPPEEWLADRLEIVELGDLPRIDVNVLYAREIPDDAADLLEQRLEDRGGPF